MSIFKCKMCGGALEVNHNETVITCEYCGTRQTLPKLDNDQRAAMFTRGDYFRRIGEFDKALSLYEEIIRENESDAEAHWCCALCRFGIEYVKDPESGEYLPTCHRASFDGFMEDVDYLAALEYADDAARIQYQHDAEKIAEVQRGILTTVQQEEPYDIFICYKETDETGKRTKDSILAQDIYYQLNEQGYRVFFARITLEDKAGEKYEPYIFAALNSAKVMLAVGTRPEHFNAVWVRNEWSRYLKLIKKDKKRILIPCYQDMSPYDLPDQLSVLQAYDMSKIGFIQDLLHGLSKVLRVEAAPVVEKENRESGSVADKIEPLLKRVTIFLEDGNWKEADEYCERVLDMNPENARAYLGKLMAYLKVGKTERLKNCSNPFDHLNQYKKVMRFADDAMKKMLEEANAYIRERNESERKDHIYQLAKEQMEKAADENTFKEIAQQFVSISGWKDADALQSLCLEKAEIARKDAIYNEAKRQTGSTVVANVESAIRLFESIPSWKDSQEQIEECKRKIEELTAKAEADRLERERQEEHARWEAERIAKRNKKLAIISTAIVAVVIVFLIVLNTVILPHIRLNQATALLESGDYDAAYAMLEELGKTDIINSNKWTIVNKKDTKRERLRRSHLLKSQFFFVGSQVSI